MTVFSPRAEVAAGSERGGSTSFVRVWFLLLALCNDLAEEEFDPGVDTAEVVGGPLFEILWRVARPWD